jgi:hypothetical protein
MFIHFKQSGGLTGGYKLTKDYNEVPIIFDKLKPSEKEKVNRLINNTNFFNLNSNTSEPTPDSKI